MRLADDDRARVPFALVGVVLLVGSAAFAATTARQGPAADEPAAGTAIETAKSSTHAAIYRAVERAGREAASNPVVEPANTSYGRVLNDSEPFRDYLRVRIYLAVEHALDDVATREGDVVARPSIPGASNASALRDGKRRIAVEPVAENGSAGLRVWVRNVTLTATRGDRTLDQRTYTPSVVVSTPALALHTRTQNFETRLNRGPLDGPGLGRRLTARTYALAWVRGYAQYGGAPIENVVGNRHLELLTNGALLREQRRAFGHGDPAARRAMGWATARVAATDLTTASEIDGGRWVERLERAAEREETPTDVPALTDTDAPRRTNASVGVNRSADAAFARFVGGDGSTTLESAVASVYCADVKLEASVDRTDARSWTTGRPPDDWTLVDETTETSVRVEPTSGSYDPAPEGWDRYRSYVRTVVHTRTTTKRWRDGNRTRRTEHHRRVTYRVKIGVVGKPAPRAPGPSGDIESLYEPGGPLDGPNMQDVPAKAVTRLVAERGGADELARRAVAGSLDTGVETVQAERPDDLSTWLYADLARLRDEVRNVSVVVDHRSAATGRQQPAAVLAQELDERRAGLVGAPETYGSVAARARVAARAAYLDSVQERLDERSEQSEATRTNVEEALDSADLPSVDRIERVLAARKSTTPGRAPIPVAAPDREMNVSVDAGPSYLALDATTPSTDGPTDGRYHPLAARNHNAFTLPYGEVADEVTEGLFAAFDSRRVDLRTAARTLRAADRTLAHREDPELVAARDDLRADVDASMGRVRGRLASVLARESALGARASQRAVADGLDRWNGTAERALAVSNGSAAAPVAAAAVERLPADERTDRRRDWLAVRLRLALAEATKSERVRPPQQSVEPAANRTRELAREALSDAVERGLRNATERATDRWFGESLSAVPQGLPVTPVPGHWYATVNVWRVEVGGTYDRFSVRARHGGPASGVAYNRANRTVAADVNGDGDPEQLGDNEPVSFRTETVVLVAVPPGGGGVGDGEADERSPGWPPDRSDNP